MKQTFKLALLPFIFPFFSAVVVKENKKLKVCGIHDLFLVAHGGGADKGEYLFNINWFTFTRDAHD